MPLAGAAAAALIAGALHVVYGFREANREKIGAEEFTTTMMSVGLCLNKYLPPGTRIALNPVGAVPYYSGLPALDMLGLTNRHIAHATIARMGKGLPGHEKGDGAYVLDQRPEVILFANVAVSPSGPVRLETVRLPATLRSEFEIARDPRVTKMYALDQLPLDDGRYLVFLRRRDFVLARRP